MNHNQILKRDKQTTIRSIGIIEIGADISKIDFK